MERFFRKYSLLFCLVILLILAITVPLLLQYVFKVNKGNWDSFWGSYLGIIPAGIISALLILLERQLNKADKTRENWNALYIELLELKNNRVKHLEFLFSDWALLDGSDDHNKQLLIESSKHCEAIIKYSSERLAPFLFYYSSKNTMEDPFAMQFHVLSTAIKGLLVTENYHPDETMISVNDEYAKKAVNNFDKVLAKIKERVTI